MLTYNKINSYLYTENIKPLESMRESYYSSMGRYFSAYLEWSKIELKKAISINNNNYTNEYDTIYEEMAFTCWLFGMDLYSSICLAQSKNIKYEKHAEPSEDKVKLYMEDGELKANALTKYDIFPVIRYFLDVIIFPMLIEKDKQLLNYPYRSVYSSRIFLENMIQDIYLLCYLQFER